MALEASARKRVHSVDDLNSWKASRAWNDLNLFILHCAESVKGVLRSSVQKKPKSKVS